MKVIRENGAAAGAGVLATFAYDNPGRRTSLTRGSGTVTSYAYDAVSRLSQLSHDLPGTASDLVLGFRYNPASQIVSNGRIRSGPGRARLLTLRNGLSRLAASVRRNCLPN